MNAHAHHHHHAHRYSQTKRMTIFVSFTNALLGFLKIIFGLLGHSMALVADGIHSFADLITDVLVFFAVRFSTQAADLEHPYGHARIETAATVLLAVIVILSGAGIAYDAVIEMHEKTLQKPDFYVLVVAFISIVIKEILYRYTLRVAKHIDSRLLQANAWHHRSDAAASMVVLIGITGAILGFRYLDAIAAIIVGLMVAKMGWELGWSSIRELIDTGVDPELLEKMHETISTVPGVRFIHQLRTRSMSGRILVDVHVQVDPDLSVSEGHYIGHQVHHQLQKKIPSIQDVTVHIDPENDEVAPLTHDLHPREEVLKVLEEKCRGLKGSDEMTHIHLHYLSGKIQVEIVFPHAVLSNPAELQVLTEQYRKALADIKYISSVKLLFS
ncbi:MAG: cation transporter [Proteobacteria bacterium]|nr:cation transporter [Pseudomonadota bacterium]